MQLLAPFIWFLEFQGLAGQAFPLDANGISLDEKVLSIERLLLTPGTIIFPVDPCNEILNGPPGNGPNGPDQIGDQTSAREFSVLRHTYLVMCTRLAGVPLYFEVYLCL
jgi:hypothetical protein